MIIAICFLTQSYLWGQSVNLENSFKVDTLSSQVLTQRIEISTPTISFKYDYKANGRDVLGVIMPKIISDSTSSWGGVILKSGDGNEEDQFAFDTWASKKWGKFSATVELGRIVSPASKPWDFAGTRLSYRNFTTEFYALSYHPMLGEKMTKQDATYGWLAYHPKHAFIAVGKQDRQYWGFVGTKNLKRFGNFTFINYQPETGNFWFRSQSGFGEINQKFFCQDSYVEGTSYMVVPVFYYKHFSPICTKGEYSLKVDGRRTNGVQNYEIMMGKKIGDELLRVAVGINSEYQTDLRLAPSFELYKSWKFNDWQGTVELRYDLLYKTLNGYLIVRY